MRLVCFEHEGGVALGSRDRDKVTVIARPKRHELNGCFADLAALARSPSGPVLEWSAVQQLPPVPNPGKIICIGLNYLDHAKEGGHPKPGYPAVFLRTTTSLAAPDAPLLRPPCSDKFDYEAELAIVIGRPAHRVKEADALQHVAGYSCFNDGSLRDYQRKSTQWTMGKNFDRTGGF